MKESCVCKSINDMQGEHELSKDNYLLGEFILEGFAVAPKGVAKAIVIFDIDANGILTAIAKDSITGNAKGITIKNINEHLQGVH